MPDVANHLKQARLNQEFCLSPADLTVYAYRQWIVTSAFYSALHLVDAVLANNKKHPADHLARDGHVFAYLPKIFGDYRLLKDESIDARYNCRTLSANHIRQSTFVNLDKIAVEVGQQLGMTPVFAAPTTPPPPPPAPVTPAPAAPAPAPAPAAPGPPAPPPLP